MNIVQRWMSIAIMNIICVTSAWADGDLSSLLNGIHTMRADFSQVVYDNHDKAIQKANGQMALMRPGKFRWQVTKPIPQLIIANGAKLWIYDPDLEQVTIRPMTQTSGDAPALLLSHVNASIEKDYAITLAKNSKPGWIWYTLVPHNNDNMFATVKMGFKNQQIQEMDLIDHLGHRTHIAFLRAQVNQELPANLFVFKAAGNVDVIDETKRHR